MVSSMADLFACSSFQCEMALLELLTAFTPCRNYSNSEMATRVFLVGLGIMFFYVNIINAKAFTCSQNKSDHTDYGPCQDLYIA